MNIFIFIVYLVLFTWFIPKIPFFKNSGITASWLRGLFILKIAAGLAFAWFYALPQYIGVSDTFRYFEASKNETQWLLHDPLAFIKDLFSYGYNKSGGLFSSANSYWNDLKDNTIIKLLALCNVFTFSKYYADIIFFNFLYFFGPVAFFKLLKMVTNAPNLQLIIPIFLLPSFLFWCSGIHKDGLIFSAIGLTIYFFYMQIHKKKFSFFYSLIILFSLLLLFALRNFIALILIPSLFAWFVAERFPAKKWIAFISLYIIGAGIFFATLSSSHFDLPAYIITKQKEFTFLSGGSEIKMPLLQHNIESFLYYFPYSVDLNFLRPYPTDIKNLSYVPPLIENLLVISIIILSFLYRDKSKKFHPASVFCLFFSFAVLTIIGYTVPFLGASVRYKSDVLSLFITPFFIRIDWNKLLRSKY